MKIVAAKKLLKANDQLAADNRAHLDAVGVLGINIVGSPGAGKTTLLEALFERLRGRLRMAVIEGDIAGSIDAQRMESLGVPVVQINTEGACHLDAAMVGAAMAGLDLDAAEVLFIENVGNLVCTAGFDLGEHRRVALLSIPEGDDKIVKYPAIFQGSDVLVVTKNDLAALSNFQFDRVVADQKRLNEETKVFAVSALRNQGIDELADWLVAQKESAGK